MGDNQQRVYPVLPMEANKKKTSLAPGKTEVLPVQQPTLPPRVKTNVLPVQRPILPPREKTNVLPVQQPIPPPAVIHNKRSMCCKCFCWVLSLLVTALIALAVVVAVIYVVFRPKLPQYEVNSLRVTNLAINLDLSLSAEFKVEITARNPNKKIGIYYEKGGHIGVWYTKTKLCEGPIPRFYQGHQNVTKLNVALTGRAQYGNTVLTALQQQQQTGRVPLDLQVVAPVKIKLGKLKLKKIRILGKCKLVVDSLSTNNNINIKASDCSFKLKL